MPKLRLYLIEDADWLCAGIFHRSFLNFLSLCSHVCKGKLEADYMTEEIIRNKKMSKNNFVHSTDMDTCEFQNLCWMIHVRIDNKTLSLFSCKTEGFALSQPRAQALLE